MQLILICLLVYVDGNVCISILHSPQPDEMSGELVEERWLPTRSISSIMMSIMSMLNEPNINSPANLTASVQYRDEKVEYLLKCQQISKESLNHVPEHVVIAHPETNPEERKAIIEKNRILSEEDIIEDSEHYQEESPKKVKSKTKKSKKTREEVDEQLDEVEIRNLQTSVSPDTIVPWEGCVLVAEGGKVKKASRSTKSVSMDYLTMLLYNVLRYPTVKGEIRLNYIMDVILEAQADIIVLTNVSDGFFKELIKSNWVEEYFIMCEPEFEKGVPLHVGNVVLSRVIPISFTYYELPSRTTCKLLHMLFNINKKTYCIGATCFEDAPMETKLRFEQWSKVQTIFRNSFLPSTKETFILLGDFGRGAKSKEAKFIKREWTDMWEQKRPMDPGYTLDPNNNSLARQLYKEPMALRRDRIIYSHCDPLDIRNITLVGQKKIPDEKYKGDDLYPSDRFGVAVTIATPRPVVEEGKSCSTM